MRRRELGLLNMDSLSGYDHNTEFGFMLDEEQADCICPVRAFAIPFSPWKRGSIVLCGCPD
jgi:hypothetical protein